MLTLERLKEVLHYAPETGVFTHLLNAKNKAYSAGAVAGCYEKAGYCRIGIDGKGYQAHRLAWFYVHGAWPLTQIDHKNRNGFDNRITNLREATKAQNKHNSAPYGATGIKGVFPSGRRFVVYFTVHKKRHYVGSYASVLAAEVAAGQFQAIHHKEFAYVA